MRYIDLAHLLLTQQLKQASAGKLVQQVLKPVLRSAARITPKTQGTLSAYGALKATAPRALPLAAPAAPQSVWGASKILGTEAAVTPQIITKRVAPQIQQAGDPLPPMAPLRWWNGGLKPKAQHPAFSGQPAFGEADAYMAAQAGMPLHVWRAKMYLQQQALDLITSGGRMTEEAARQARKLLG